MKTLTMALALLIMAAALMADPFADYQKNPGDETFAAANSFFRQKLAADSTDAQSRLMLGYLLYMEADRATGWFARHEADLNAGQRFGYANLLLAMGQYEDAVPQYEKLNQASPEWSCPWRHKGQALYQSGHYAEAEQSLQKAIETRKEHYDAYIWLAKTQHAMKKDAEALSTLETGLGYLGQDSENPEAEVDDLDVRFLHLTLLEANHRADEANKLRADLMRDAPNDPRL